MTDSPQDRDRRADEEAEAAAAEAARIGGPNPDPGADPERRAPDEAGEGYAEGFEAAEELLERRATHQDRGTDPVKDAGEPEDDPGSEFAEADHAGSQGEGERD